MDKEKFNKLMTVGGYVYVNDILSEKLGYLTTVFLKLLTDLYYLNKDKNQLTKNGEFYCTEKLIKKLLNISRATQTRIKKNLKEIGILEMSRKELPSKNFYKINFDIIEKIIKNEAAALKTQEWTQKESTSGLKKLQLVDSKSFNLYIYNNNIKNINNNKEFISKEIICNNPKGSLVPISINPVDKIKKNNDLKDEKTKELPMILKKYWNNKINLSKHKDGTKNCIICKRALKDLMNGTYFRKNNLDPDFMDKNNIPSEAIKHKFTRKEIKTAIENLDNFHNGAYLPTNSNRYPKGFLSCLYNGRPRNFHNGGTSLFLRCFYNPPKLISSTFKKDNYPEYTELVIDFINERRGWLNAEKLELSEIEQNKLVQRVADIICAFKAIIRNPDKSSYCKDCKKNCRNWDSQFMDMHIEDGKEFYKLFDLYFNTVTEYFTNQIIEPHMIGPDNKIWHKFCSNIFESYKVCMENVRFG